MMLRRIKINIGELASRSQGLVFSVSIFFSLVACKCNYNFILSIVRRYNIYIIKTASYMFAVLRVQIPLSVTNFFRLLEKNVSVYTADMGKRIHSVVRCYLLQNVSVCVLVFFEVVVRIAATTRKLLKFTRVAISSNLISRLLL